MALTIRAAVMAGALAGTTMMIAPASASAAPLATGTALGSPSAVFAHSRYDPASGVADWRCGWGRPCGWGGWGGGWGRRGWRRNRIDAGDVLIGAAVIGGIAAIVSANNRRQRDRDVVIVERDADFRDRNRDWERRDDRRVAPRGTGASGLDNAVNMCLDRIERDVRVDTVDDVERNGAGWQVSGTLFNGSPFRCRIGNSGQIEGIDYDGSFAGAGLGSGAAGAMPPRADGQWSDDRYASARAALGGGTRPDMAVSEARLPAATVAAGRNAGATTAMPAYPGGPIPGEIIPETIDGDIGG